MRFVFRLKSENGYSLIELLTVMAITTVVMTGVTALFVQGSNAQVDMNGRFQAQQAARLSLDKIRSEAHCASLVTLTGQTQATMTLPSSCGTQISWCTVAVGSSGSRYALYRQTGATCGTGGVKWADYLTSGAAFSYTAQSTQNLASLGVDLPINLTPSKAFKTYELKGRIVLRNSTRS
ncbi:MAG: prepilin-type N-terminal cleavage/methylation domain-containing protein [Actinomycetota bacterium]|nr:prepilin-type N-terminal cleavage/methylation domain-containing protein [Actinomycetota bacterium]